MLFLKKPFSSHYDCVVINKGPAIFSKIEPLIFGKSPPSWNVTDLIEDKSDFMDSIPLDP